MTKVFSSPPWRNKMEGSTLLTKEKAMAKGHCSNNNRLITKWQFMQFVTNTSHKILHLAFATINVHSHKIPKMFIPQKLLKSLVLRMFLTTTAQHQEGHRGRCPPRSGRSRRLPRATGDVLPGDGIDEAAAVRNRACHWPVACSRRRGWQ